MRYKNVCTLVVVVVAAEVVWCGVWNHCQYLVCVWCTRCPNLPEEPVLFSVLCAARPPKAFRRLAATCVYASLLMGQRNKYHNSNNYNNNSNNNSNSNNSWNIFKIVNRQDPSGQMWVVWNEILKQSFQAQRKSDGWKKLDAFFKCICCM